MRDHAMTRVPQESTRSRRPLPFDITGEFPDGTTVLEASAGTGKTHAIVGIAARHIADGVPIGELLLITFSRSATAELRERMRERLTELVGALEPSRRTERTADPLIGVLRVGSAQEVDTRRHRLLRALSDFDASTIATTHTFCNRMLEALGFLGERELIYDIVEGTDDLVEQTARDLYLARFAADAQDAPFTLPEITAIAKEAVRSAGVPLAPEPAVSAHSTQQPSVADLRVRFCRRTRELVERRKRLSRLRTYDDLQLILHSVVTDDLVGDGACERIRSAFRLVLVDEFQDTDPFQWEILRRCFHGHRRLVLVGDPKQSIYAFRGAEVRSYLQAVGVADNLLVLDTNWRTDGDLVDALTGIYGGAGLGDPSIAVHPVTAARPGSRLTGTSALRLRAFTVEDFPERSSALPSVGEVRARVIADTAADIARLLSSSARIDSGQSQRPLLPGDVAILVRTNTTIAPLQQALAAHGIASVVGTGTSVFRTSSARHWLWVLRAVEAPTRADRVRLAALTPLIGWGADELADATDAALADLSALCAELAGVFGAGGFAALAHRLMARCDVARRVLATVDGERELTDLLQVSSLANRHVSETDCGISALTEWLAERIADDSGWRSHDDQTRRLDRDTEVVQIMTVHASKGLEFPVVYAPFGWDTIGGGERETFRFHDDTGRRRLDVGGKGTPGRPERLAAAKTDEAGEDLRLLYVALTRAACAVVVWWAPSNNTARGPLHRLLFGRDGGDRSVVSESVPIPSTTTLRTRLHELEAGPASIVVEHAGDGDHLTWQQQVAGPQARPALAVARFDRVIDQEWRRTSYTALIAGAGHAHAVLATGSEPDAETPGDGELIVDEPSDAASVLAGAVAALDGPGVVGPQGDAADPYASLMNRMPFGAAFGTLVHEVLEYVDTGHPDSAAHVRDLCAAAARRHGADVDIDALTRALMAVLRTPIGFGDLWGVPPRNRLAELDFEFPLGRDGASSAALGDIAGLMLAHLPADDRLRNYAPILAELPDRVLRGFLTGSIDSVLRTPDGRFVIVDYKTNRLRPGDLRAQDFTADAMAQEMIRSHYPLQALLYSVALHRYLRWRLPGYRPAEHLGPVQYHFVRGMIGPSTPPGCGVFEWQVPPQLVTALSDRLAGVSVQEQQ
ncbi:MAG: UvrD-helicase domain-containing protein [Gordonia sp. (in: high G+C Gram-positive bacteria)]